jgi:hypothetical protein
MIRGRDSLLLEMQTGTCNLAMSVVCYLMIAHRETYGHMEELFGRYFTLHGWGVMWLVCGVGLLASCWYRYRPGIEWFSMLSVRFVGSRQCKINYVSGSISNHRLCCPGHLCV